MTTKTNILDKFKTDTVDECGDAFGIKCECLMPGTTAYLKEFDGYSILVAVGEDGSWGCEIDDEDGCCEAYEMGETAEDALRAACITTFGIDAVISEGNAEDATNVAAYRTFEAIMGRFPEWNTDGDMELMDAILKAVRDRMPNIIKNVNNGTRWEEF